MVKNLPVDAGDRRDAGSIPELGRFPREGKGHPLQYSGLENSMDCTVPGVTGSDTTERLSLSGSLSLEHPADKGLLTFALSHGPKQGP